MDRLYNNCQRIVSRNTKVKNGDVSCVIALSLLSLYLTLDSSITKKIPSILKKLNIYSDSRSVLEIAHQELKKFNVDGDLSYAISSVVRNVNYKGNKVSIDRNMIIPCQNIHSDPIKFIEKTTHELIHLLRFGDVYSDSEKIELHDGVAIKTIDKRSGRVSTKNKMLEEAIVQEYAKNATQALLEYLATADIDSCIVRDVVRKSKGYKSTIYDIPVHLLEEFLKDGFFSSLVKDTFYNNSVSQIEFYFNAVFNSNCAFSNVSSAFDNVFSAIQSGNRDAVKQLINYIIGFSIAINRRDKRFIKN